MTARMAFCWTVVLGLLLVGTIATTPWLLRDGGWMPIATCAAWAACIPGALYLAVCLAERRRPVSKSPPVGLLLILLVVFFGMLLGPAVVVAFVYGPEAATGASYISAFISLSGIVVSALVYNWRSQSETTKREQFLARFKSGPIGVWRGVRLNSRRVEEEGCGIAFSPDGAGHYRLWEGAENEAAATARSFHWRPAGENQIELSLDDGSLKELEFMLPYMATKTVKLMLRLPGVELPEIFPYEVGFAEFDRIHWPRYLVFDYLGEPAESAPY